MADKPPILVTGSHRSGTTWAGEMLWLAPNTAYLHEPFNIEDRCRFVTGYPRDWFHCVTPEEDGLYRRRLGRMLRFHYPLFHRLAELREAGQLKRIGREWRRMRNYRRSLARPIVKDPIAFFSADWLAAAFGMQVLAMIRHPAAFCSSLVLKGWEFDFNHFQRQPLLMERHLAPFADKIAAQARRPGDVLSQAILLWNCFHHTMANYRRDHPDWVFARHEDLSRDPVGGFRAIYAAFGLDFTDEVVHGIERATGAHNPTEQRAGNETVRDARANIDNWKQRLSPDQVALIRETTAEIAAQFYSDEDW